MRKYFYYPHTQENRITEDSKLLIGIGDSFCAGRGACSIELWEKYDGTWKECMVKVERKWRNQTTQTLG
jgi:hypothetical protein